MSSSEESKRRCLCLGCAGGTLCDKVFECGCKIADLERKAEAVHDDLEELKQEIPTLWNALEEKGCDGANHG